MTTQLTDQNVDKNNLTTHAIVSLLYRSATVKRGHPLRCRPRTSPRRASARTSRLPRRRSCARSRATCCSGRSARAAPHLTKLEKLANFAIFVIFWRARSRLYQNETFQENMRLTACFKMYKMCTRLHRSKLNNLDQNLF